MSWVKTCCVPGCKESGGMHPVLHGFPNPEVDRPRFNSWLYAIGGNLLGLENERIYKYRRVCHAHFEDRYRCRNNRISNIAVPTLNMPDIKSQLRFSLVERRPMQNVAINTMQATTSGGESKDPDVHLFEESLTSLAATSVERIPENKENIDAVVMVPPNTTNTQEADNSRKDILDAVVMAPPIDYTPNTPQEADNLRKDIHGDGTETMANPANAIPMVISSTVTETDKSRKAKLEYKTKIRKISKRQLYITKPEKKLREKLIACRIKLSKCRNKIKRQSHELKIAKSIASNLQFRKVMENLSSTSKIIVLSQFREHAKKEKGRRFTKEEKIIALCILKQSPKAYRFLRRIFLLPSPQTLVKLLQKCCIEPGVNKNVFSQLKKKSEKMKTEEKLCVIIFDEVSLKPHLSYNERRDKVVGFVDNGEETVSEFADHAQVFMLRGLVKNYKQALSYTFSSSATKGAEIAKQLKMIISEVQKAGFIVVATICDQGTNNRQAIKLLLQETRGVLLRRGETPKSNTFLINDYEIVPLYDPPHLLKGVRNNFISKKIKYTTGSSEKTAEWTHLHLLLKENGECKGVQFLPKLTENHVVAEKISKMKVKFAAQIFSYTVGSTMLYLAGKEILPKEAEDTANLLLFFDKLFDSVNGSFGKNRYAKELLGPVTPYSKHHKFWNEATTMLKNMKFINKNGKAETVPSLNNWVWTLEGLEVLLKKLQKEYRVTSVWLRHLNQDPLENFFGVIRSHGCRNNNPTPDQFQSAFTTTLINSLASVNNSSSTNCEKDTCKNLYDLVVNEDSKAAPPCEVNLNIYISFDFTPITDKTDPRIMGPLQYVSGYIVKETQKKIFQNCTACKENLMTANEIEYIKCREYEGKRWLCYPSDNMIELISKLQDIINHILRNDLNVQCLKEFIKTVIMMLGVDFDFINCNVHKKKVCEFIINCTLRCLIFNYCKNVNKILMGRKSGDINDQFQMKAKKYFNKCYKRKL